MNINAKWIRTLRDMGDACPVFVISFECLKKVVSAKLEITAVGVYEARLNGERVGEFILAPGWTFYEKRLQVQEYDVTNMITSQNELAVTVAKGWYRGRLLGGDWPERIKRLESLGAGLIACLKMVFEDGTVKEISTNEDWIVKEGPVRFAEIYDGEVYDATFESSESYKVEVFEGPTETLIPQQGEEVREQERIAAMRMFVTPEGDTIVDFGQEIAGYVEVIVDADKGDIVQLSFAEMMDKHGNFYNENYRTAKCQYVYICKEGRQMYKPNLTFYGFRYIRIDNFPGGIKNAKLNNFTAIVVHSQMKRTGYLRSSNILLNKLMDNVFWSQKGNFLDVPTDCPTRDERLGWAGDAQVFIRTACLNYDTENFYVKWLADMAAGQKQNGYVGHVIPDHLNFTWASAAWGDAATICPWALYLAYGNPEILAVQYDCMEKWVNYITASTTSPYLWTGGTHYEDWLALDAPCGSFKGASRADFIASAFYAHSTDLLIKAGKVLQKDMTKYEQLHRKIVETFRKTYKEYTTQTECVLAAYFNLAENTQAVTDQLTTMIKADGGQLRTGILGTPYLLHVLSDHGYVKLAYDLLLRTEYPSWLYPVTKGATTIWEHWDGINENGDFFIKRMNSFNHYIFGSVLDWVYTQAAGINNVENAPGYKKIKFSPLPDSRIDWLEGALETRSGFVRSRWEKQDDMWRYEIETPVDATIVINGKEHFVKSGRYIFYDEIKL